jgi:hypothetical protein
VRYGNSQLAPSPRAREQAVEAARAAGQMGAARVPDEALFPGGLDPSDSCVIAVLDAFLSGQLERQQL